MYVIVNPKGEYLGSVSMANHQVIYFWTRRSEQSIRFEDEWMAGILADTEGGEVRRVYHLRPELKYA